MTHLDCVYYSVAEISTPMPAAFLILSTTPGKLVL